MSRLRYSKKGYIRSLQMSRKDIFAFVEGWSDRYFYDRICEVGCAGLSLEPEVRTASELPGGTGGKKALIEFFLYLRRAKLLLHDFIGKRTAIIFFVDKDIDDILKIRKRSNHFIYTEHYHLENYVFLNTDICETAAAVSALDLDSVKGVIGNQTAWMQRAATEWKEWVKLCTVARLLGVTGIYNFSVTSRINAGPYQPLDTIQLAAFIGQLQSASGLAPLQFQRRMNRVSALIDRIYATGQHDRVFKGGWYGGFLSLDLKTAAGGRAYSQNAIEERVKTASLAKLDFTRPWAGYFTNSVSSLAQALQQMA
jgi:hypothetical protein